MAAPYTTAPIFPGTTVGPPAPTNALRNQFTGTLFAGYDAAPDLPKTVQYPENMQPSVYAQDAQMGMFWAQETLPHLYLHKIPLTSTESSTTRIAKRLHEDVAKNVRGITNSNTPNWPLFALRATSQTPSNAVMQCKQLQRDLMRYKDVTGVFCTWQTLVEELDKHSDGAWDNHKVKFTGVLKNIPTGGVGSDCIAMNLIVGGRVSLPNYWGNEVVEGVGLYFLLVKRINTDFPDNKYHFIPYCDAYTNITPHVGKMLSIEERWNAGADGKCKKTLKHTHEIIQTHRVGVALDVGCSAVGHQPPYKLIPYADGAYGHDFSFYLRDHLTDGKTRINRLGKMEVYLGV